MSYLESKTFAYKAIFIYCLLFYCIRLFHSPNLSLDEAEQMFFSQTWAWIYRFRHPSLINWMVKSIQELFGVNSIGLHTLKYLIMTIGHLFFYHAAVEILKSRYWALMSTGGLLATFIVGYKHHNDLMHTILLTTLLSANLYYFSLIFKTSQLKHYILLGVTIGIGFLSKYVFILFPLSIFISVILIDKKKLNYLFLFCSLMVAGIITSPYLYQVIVSGESFKELVHSVLRPKSNYWLSLIYVQLRFIVSYGVFLIPFIAFVILLFGKIISGKIKLTSQHDLFFSALLKKTAWIQLIVISIGILVNNGSVFKGRWMHQSAFFIPILIFIYIKNAKPSVKKIKIYLICIFLSISTAATVRVLDYSQLMDCDTCRFFIPFQELAEKLKENGIDKNTVIIADTYLIAGNLRLYFPENIILAREFFHFKLPYQSQSYIILWMGKNNIPDKLKEYLIFDLKLNLPSSYNIQTEEIPLLKFPTKNVNFHYLKV